MWSVFYISYLPFYYLHLLLAMLLSMNDCFLPFTMVLLSQFFIPFSKFLYFLIYLFHSTFILLLQIAQFSFPLLGLFLQFYIYFVNLTLEILIHHCYIFFYPLINPFLNLFYFFFQIPNLFFIMFSQFYTLLFYCLLYTSRCV